MERDPGRPHHGRGRGCGRRRLPGHRGPPAQVRLAAGDRQPAGRGRHRRHLGGHGALRAAPGLRDPVLRLRLPVLPSDRESRRRDTASARRGASRSQLVVRMPYGGGVRALEHHSESEEQFYAHVPGLKMVVPSSPAQCPGAARGRHSRPGPRHLLRGQGALSRGQGGRAGRAGDHAARPRTPGAGGRGTSPWSPMGPWCGSPGRPPTRSSRRMASRPRSSISSRSRRSTARPW